MLRSLQTQRRDRWNQSSRGPGIRANPRCRHTPATDLIKCADALGAPEHTAAMAFDAVLAQRIRTLLIDTPHIEEKSMFGGLAFLVIGRMAVAANSSADLMVRVDPEEAVDLIDPPTVRAVEMRGHALRRWLEVRSDALGDDVALREWVNRGIDYATSLTPAYPEAASQDGRPEGAVNAESDCYADRETEDSPSDRPG